MCNPQEGTVTETYTSLTWAQPLAFARGLFQLLSNSHLPREVFTVQNMGCAAHHRPLSVQTQNVTEVSYLLLPSATNEAADAPRGRKGWTWPFWTQLSTRTLIALILLSLLSHILCSSKMFVFRKSDSSLILERTELHSNNLFPWTWKHYKAS